MTRRPSGIAGLAAAIVAGAQIAGGLLVPRIRKLFKSRTTVFIVGGVVSTLVLVLLGATDSFWVAIALLVVWALMFSAIMPIRQAFVNGCIPSKQRATVLSFDALLGSSGGVVSQPLLGRSADVWSYSTSYFFTAAITAAAIPFYLLAKREQSPADLITDEPPLGARRGRLGRGRRVTKSGWQMSITSRLSARGRLLT